jgi:hypothetical protein
MVTLCSATEQASPAMKPVSPVRAPLDRASMATGAFTACDVTLTMRPNLRSIMPSNVALIRARRAPPHHLPAQAALSRERH